MATRRNARAHPQVNPVRIGKHPDLFSAGRDLRYLAPKGTPRIDLQRAARGEPPLGETDVWVEDWRDASPNDLRRAAKSGIISEEDLAEIGSFGEDDFEEMREQGVPRALAQAIVDGLHQELLNLDEEGRAQRAEPFIKWMRDRAYGHLEYEFEPGNDGYNNIVDQFQSDLERASLDEIQKAVEESDVLSSLGEDVDLDQIEDIEEILRDPANWRVYRRRGYGRVPGTIWAWPIEDVHDQSDGAENDDELKAILFGGEHTYSSWGDKGRAWNAGERDPNVLNNLQGDIARSKVYPGLGQADIEYAVHELENNEPYIHFETHWNRETHARDTPTPEFFRRSFDYTISEYADDYMIATPDPDTMPAALAEALKQAPPAVGPEHDDVVYVYSGTHESVAGPDAKGLYVAKLSPKELRREGALQGICIGNENLGHPRALREGRTQVFSIRTPAGKPKFTIELRRDYASKPHGYMIHREGVELGAGHADEIWRVAEVKGKANRQPGFEAGSGKMTKPSDVRLVTDFLLSLGYAPEYLRTVTDLAPGVTAMVEAGVDPFVPPPRRVRPPKPNPRSHSDRVARLLAKTRPMGRFS